MNKYYIGENALDLSAGKKSNVWTRVADWTNDEDYINCPVKTVDARESQSRFYYTVGIGERDRITCDTGSSCVVYPIKNGYMKGAYAVVNNGKTGRKSHVYIVTDKSILLYQTRAQQFSADDIETLVSDDALIERTASVLTTLMPDKFEYDNQEYKTYCSDLPASCLKNYNFRKKVMRKMRSMPLTIRNVPDVKFYNEKYCRRKAQEYFRRITEQKGCDGSLTHYKKIAKDYFKRLLHRIENVDCLEK